MYHTPELQHSFVTLNHHITKSVSSWAKTDKSFHVVWYEYAAGSETSKRDMYNYNKQLNSWKKS